MGHEPLSAIGRRLGGMSLSGATETMRRNMGLAMEYEAYLNQGRALGLTPDETREVFRVWQEHYSRTPYPLNWSKARSALTLRACDEEWRP